MLPTHIDHLIIGAGIHGLSTGLHLAQGLKASGQGDGSNILILDKKAVGAGASGIACGVIRNNYFQPAMRELMAHSVEAWEADPKALSYHPVGYMQISSEVMHQDVASIYEQQQRIGYASRFIEGEAHCHRYMRGLFDDWQAQGITSVLHETRGGYANSQASMKGLAHKVQEQGVSILAGVTVTGFERDRAGAITAVTTDRGVIRVGHVVIAPGPWAPFFWDMLELPRQIDIKVGEQVQPGVNMWRYLCLQEGVLEVDPNYLKTNDGEMPPVLHVDTDAPLYSIKDGARLTDGMWGVYYKPDFGFGGVQGGTSPYDVPGSALDVKIDPYGPESPQFVVDDRFAEMWVSALAFCHKRFEGMLPKYRQEPSGGLGAFTPDSFPIFDTFCGNAYMILDANHGYKMLGVGQLVAQEILGGSSPLLEPFRFERYARGELHPTSHSPFPWS